MAGFEKHAGEQQEAGWVHNQEQQFLGQYAASAREFSAGHADFDDAYAYLNKSVDDELKMRGFDDPAERANVLHYEEGQLAKRAFAAGKNPAEVIYDFAKHRGYTASGANEEDDEDDKLARLKEGAEASKSLAGPGAKGEGAVTLERLSELADSDPAAFDREWEKAKRSGLLG